MDLILTRKYFRPDGIFGEISEADTGEFLFFSLEHSYDNVPKVPDGMYTCQRGLHQLSHLDPKTGQLVLSKPFTTYEVMNVKGHWGILFHVGNYNRDSSGCILVGLGMGHTLDGGKMITNSKVAMAKFVNFQYGAETFKLLVESEPMD